MKKTLYLVLLAAEFLVGFWLLSRVTKIMGWTYFAIVTVVWAGLVALLLAKGTDKRKTGIAVALATLLPAVAGLTGLFQFARIISAVS